MQVEEVFVAAHDDVGVPVHGGLEELVVARIGAGLNVLYDLDDFDEWREPQEQRIATFARSNFGESSFLISSRTVALLATSWWRVIARSTARAGVEVVENDPLIRTLVSMTTRSRAIVRQELGESFAGETARGCLRSDFLPQIEKRLNVPGPQSLVVGHRQHDGDVAVLAANHDRLALRLIEDGTESVLRFCCGDRLHIGHYS